MGSYEEKQASGGKVCHLESRLPPAGCFLKSAPKTFRW